MKKKLEKTKVVVSGLFKKMECLINAYGPGARKVALRVDGTAFFPGGIGLWRGSKPRGDIPKYFPESPIMILGHNFDKVAGLEASWWRGIEQMEGATWLVLRGYLDGAKVDKLDCFFTNVFMGLQPLCATGAMVGEDEHKKQCRTFLHEQIKRVKPRLVAVLGEHAKEEYRNGDYRTPVVYLIHPMYAFAKGRNSAQCAAIIATEAAKLRKAIYDLHR